MECHKKDSLFSGVTGKERDTGMLALGEEKGNRAEINTPTKDD